MGLRTQKTTFLQHQSFNLLLPAAPTNAPQNSRPRRLRLVTLTSPSKCRAHCPSNLQSLMSLYFLHSSSPASSTQGEPTTPPAPLIFLSPTVARSDTSYFKDWQSRSRIWSYEFLEQTRQRRKRPTRIPKVLVAPGFWSAMYTQLHSTSFLA